MSDDEMMTLEEALEYIMRVTGKNRRQAEKSLLEKIRDDKLHPTGINMDTGKREPILPGDYQMRFVK
jgi:hypothetical protein